MNRMTFSCELGLNESGRPLRWATLCCIVGWLTGIVSGCGWHLQGLDRLPQNLASIHIDTDDQYSDFYRELRALLVAGGARIAPTATADAVVHVKSDTSGQHVASVSALNKPEQYEVFYSIEYSIDVAGREAVATQQAAAKSSYSYDSTAVLAKQREQASMQRALARELASQVLRRLMSAATSQTAAIAAE